MPHFLLRTKEAKLSKNNEHGQTILLKNSILSVNIWYHFDDN